MRVWRWVKPSLVYAVHDMQLARHGGLVGLRDKNAVESALGRAQQLATYGEPVPDAADLAAAYAYGLARNHGFSDGNKRTAFVAVELFLALNGFDLMATDAHCAVNMLDLAAGTLPEADFAAWIRQHIQIQML